MSSRAEAELRRAAPVFAALGDGARLRMVARLSAGEPLSIARLTEGARMTRQAVTKHLHVLERAGVVKASRHGRERMWRLTPDPIVTARRYLDVIAAQWEDALGRLKELVEAE